MRTLILLLFIIPVCLSGQDTHFAGRYAMRGFNNPALSSQYKGSEQGSVTYRRHWSSLGSDFPFQTFAATFNKKWEWLEVDEVALDLRLLKDSAPGGSFTQNQVQLGANYKKLLNDKYNTAQFISLGFSGGFGQNKANWEGLWFGNQFDFNQGLPNTNISSGENVNELLNQKTYVDLNLGLMYELFLPRFSMNANLTIGHLTRPDVSFVPRVEIRNDRKIMANVSINVLAKEELYFIFSPQYSKQGVFHFVSTKLGIAFEADDDYNINFGISAVPTLVQNFEGLGFESLGLQIFFEKSEYRFDFSYDATISKLTDFNSGRGGFEFSFIYTRRNSNYNKKSSFHRHFHYL